MLPLASAAAGSEMQIARSGPVHQPCTHWVVV